MLVTSTANMSTGVKAKTSPGDFKCQNVNWGYRKKSPDSPEPGLPGNSQQPLAAVQHKRSSNCLLSPMEHRHQSGPGLHQCPPGQPAAAQTCSRKDPAVTTPTLSHNATQRSCPQRSGEALELLQG